MNPVTDLTGRGRNSASEVASTKQESVPMDSESSPHSTSGDEPRSFPPTSVRENALPTSPPRPSGRSALVVVGLAILAVVAVAVKWLVLDELPPRESALERSLRVLDRQGEELQGVYDASRAENERRMRENR